MYMYMYMPMSMPMPMPIQRAAVWVFRHCPSGSVSLDPNDRGHAGSVTAPAPPGKGESQDTRSQTVVNGWPPQPRWTTGALNPGTGHRTP